MDPPSPNNVSDGPAGRILILAKNLAAAINDLTVPDEFKKITRIVDLQQDVKELKEDIESKGNAIGLSPRDREILSSFLEDNLKQILYICNGLRMDFDTASTKIPYTEGLETRLHPSLSKFKDAWEQVGNILAKLEDTDADQPKKKADSSLDESNRDRAPNKSTRLS